MQIFQDKIIIITGAGSGLGMGLSQALGRSGAMLILADIDWNAVQQVTQGIVAAGGKATAHQTDTREYDQVKQLIDSALTQYGRLDYLFNNAGIGISGECHEIAIEDWQRVLNVNLMGMVYGCEIAYKVMVKQGFGHIVNTASLAGLLPFPTAVPYATSKMAMVGLSRSLRIEGEKLGVKVSAICPGFVQTGIYEKAIRTLPLDKLMQNIILPIIPLDEAVQAMLKGVAQNKALIIFPFYSRLLWFLQRLFPVVATWIGRDAVNKYRALK